jgi:hypothetical protein
VTRARLNLYIEPEHMVRLNQLALMKGVTKSSIIAVALTSYLSPDAADRRDAAMAKRLDKLTRQFGKLERDQNILIETLALHVLHTLTVELPSPDPHHDAIQAAGRERFAQFVTQLGRRLQEGKSLVREVYEEVYPGEAQFLRADTAPPAKEVA